MPEQPAHYITSMYQAVLSAHLPNLSLSSCAQMFCDRRVMHNVRNGWDIAKFLAEPTLADMTGHHANLK